MTHESSEDVWGSASRVVALRTSLIVFGYLAGASLMVPAMTHAEENGPAIAAEALRRSSGFGALSARLHMQLENQRGQTSTRDLRIQILEAEDGRLMNLFRVHAPADVRGTALLSHSDPNGDEQQWLYMPATQRVRRIATPSRSGAFMGSEFTYHDLLARPADLEAAHLMRTDIHQGHPCYILGSEASDPAAMGFTHQEVWVDKTDYRVWKVRYYHPVNTHRKTLTFSDHRLHDDDFWQAYRMEMVNHLTGNRTRITWSDVTLRVALGPEDFTVHQLTRE